MQAIHKACVEGKLAASLSVISNEPSAKGLEYAHQNGLKATTLNHRDFKNRAEFDHALAELIDRHPPDLILLAGFMRRLGGIFTQRYDSRLINIHPSLLPRYPGLNTHQSVLDNKDAWHGCSIHFVTEELDGGPVIARSVVPVKLPSDTPETLAARVLEKEHQAYWRVAQMCLERTIECQDGHVLYYGKKLQYPILL